MVPLRNPDRLKIGPGEVTKTEVATPGWAAVQLLWDLVHLLVRLLALDGVRRIVLSVHHVVMQGPQVVHKMLPPVPPVS